MRGRAGSAIGKGERPRRDRLKRERPISAQDVKTKDGRPVMFSDVSAPWREERDTWTLAGDWTHLESGKEELRGTVGVLLPWPIGLVFRTNQCWMVGAPTHGLIGLAPWLSAGQWRTGKAIGWSLRACHCCAPTERATSCTCSAAQRPWAELVDLPPPVFYSIVSPRPCGFVLGRDGMRLDGNTIWQTTRRIGQFTTFTPHSFPLVAAYRSPPTAFPNGDLYASICTHCPLLAETAGILARN